MSVPTYLDRYNLTARLGPALIVALPLGLGLVAWFPKGVELKTLPLGAVITFVLAVLLTQLGRGPGRQAQAKLFKRWGGVPTTRMLSHEHTTLNPHTLLAVHARLRTLRPDLTIPATAEEERKNQATAFAVYEACTDFLREFTREGFPLVREENISYGFRRNLWAMRSPGLIASLTGFFSSVAAVCYAAIVAHSVPLYAAAYALVCLVLFVWWVLRITPDWVREQAETYASTIMQALLRP